MPYPHLPDPLPSLGGREEPDPPALGHPMPDPATPGPQRYSLVSYPPAPKFPCAAAPPPPRKICLAPSAEGAHEGSSRPPASPVEGAEVPASSCPRRPTTASPSQPKNRGERDGPRWGRKREKKSRVGSGRRPAAPARQR
jgi:hypothetical protein